MASAASLPHATPARVAVARSLRRAAWLPALILAGCSLPTTRVILLPDDLNPSSAVVVRSKGGETLLDQPYQRATAVVWSRLPPPADTVDPAETRRANAALFDLAPASPVRFTVYFETGQSRLIAASQLAMADVLATALARSGGDIVITGYTDTLGAADTNAQLSLERARLVRQMLIDSGFPAHRIETVGRGEENLAVPTPDGTAEPRNRRVVIVVR